MKSLREWIDRDWENRRYSPLFAFSQRILWVSPILIIGFIGWLVGAGPGDVLYDWGLPFGLFLMFLLFAYSGYRWFLGYSRTDWQDRAAKDHRERVAARRNWFRSLFKS